MGEFFDRARPPNSLAWTGERLTDGAGMQVEIEHLHRYFLARELARGCDVLDIASGEGYGAALLAQTARTVVGVDSDAGSVAHAERAYVRPNLSFLTGDARALPLPDASIDLVVSFETIEHIREHDEMLEELRRVLRPGGRVLVSTPDTDIYAPPGAPANPFHLRELTRSEFAALLGRHFAHVTLVGQRPLLGSAILPEDARPAEGLLTFEKRGDDRFEVSAGLPRAVYLLALASDRDLGTLPASLYIHSSSVEQPTAEALRQQSDALAVESEKRLAAEAEIERFARQIESEREAGAQKGIAHDGASTDGTLHAYVRHVEREFGKATAALAAAERYTRHVENELAAQRARGDGLDAQIAALLSSRSWEITAPFRRIGTAHPTVRRWLRGMSRIMPWVRGRGPLVPTAGEPAPALPGVAAPPPFAPPPAPETREQSKEALTEALSARLDAFLAGEGRLVFPKVEAPAVSVVIAVWNKAHFTLRCLESLLAADDVPIEVIIVDNGSTDRTGALLDRVDGATVIRNRENVGFLLANNQAARVATGETILLLNSDAFPRPGAIAAALETLAAEPGAGAVGGLLVLPSGLVQEAGSIVWSDGSTLGYGRGLRPEAGEAMFRRVVSYCSGAFLLTPRQVWNALGGFDDKYAPAYYEDADYCLRLRERGLKVVYEPRAAVDHYELGSEAKSGDATEATLRNRAYFRNRHADALAGFLPPNLDNPIAARDHDAGRSKRLLIVDDLLPLQRNGSGMPRLQAMIAAAVKAGWSVTCYVMHDRDVDWERVWVELPPGVEIIADGGIAELGDFLRARSGHYRAILVSRPHNMPLFWAAVGSHPGVLGQARVVYDAEAIFAARQIAQRAFEGAALDRDAADALIADEVQRSAAGARAVTCVTAEDREQFLRFLPPTVPVHRLGHAVDIAPDTPPHGARRGFLFVGRLFEPEAPNWQGLAWFIREAWPAIRRAIPDAELTVVGKLHPAHQALSGPGIRLMGQVADLQAVYDGARVFVAPVRVAAGVPIKIIEATAAGLPTICTTRMARQLDWPAGEALAVADDAEALAGLAVALHEDAAAWQSMVDHARACVTRDYGREAFESGLEAALEGRQEKAAEPSADSHRLSRVEAVWGAAPPSDEAAQWSTYPLSHPVVSAESNRRATGDPGKDLFGALRDLLLREGYSLPLARAASLCCGDGIAERRLVMDGIVRRCIGYDLARAALERAESTARKMGLGDSLEYRVCDLETSGLDETGLDLVVSHHAVHHISNLEFAFDNVRSALRPGGLFFLAEFVGPDRFQWTDRQLSEMNDWLASVPESYRRTRQGLLKTVTGRATIAEMIAYDPSEAVRSSAIEPLMRERFEIVEYRRTGGTLTMMALADIAHNFHPDREEDVAHLRRLLDRESELMETGAIQSDMVIMAGRRQD